MIKCIVLIVEEVLLSCLSSSMEIHISPLVLYIQGSKRSDIQIDYKHKFMWTRIAVQSVSLSPESINYLPILEKVLLSFKSPLMLKLWAGAQNSTNCSPTLLTPHFHLAVYTCHASMMTWRYPYLVSLPCDRGSMVTNREDTGCHYSQEHIGYSILEDQNITEARNYSSFRHITAHMKKCDMWLM